VASTSENEKRVDVGEQFSRRRRENGKRENNGQRQVRCEEGSIAKERDEWRERRGREKEGSGRRLLRMGETAGERYADKMAEIASLR
jgi:hypothetical protein